LIDALGDSSQTAVGQRRPQGPLLYNVSPGGVRDPSVASSPTAFVSEAKPGYPSRGPVRYPLSRQIPHSSSCRSKRTRRHPGPHR